MKQSSMHRVTNLLQGSVLIVLVAILLVPAIWTFNIYHQLIDMALRWLAVTATNWIGEFGTLFSALLLGLVAFAIRTWARPIYALIEIFFGVYGGGIALSLLYRPDLLPPAFKALAPSSTSSAYPQYVGLVSAIYVMVRGLDTWFTWIKQQPAKKPSKLDELLPVWWTLTLG